MTVEFGEKLQQLRRARDWTQEQLAEQLFVSRTAVSKWESGKGYPNIESLKQLSALFAVSIDDLLSGEELVQLAASENRRDRERLSGLLFAVLDLLAVAVLFLPLFGQADGDYIRMVTLWQLTETPLPLWISFWLLPALMVACGLCGLLLPATAVAPRRRLLTVLSLTVSSLAVLLFIAARSPYVASFLFLLLLGKLLLLWQNQKR